MKFLQDTIKEKFSGAKTDDPIAFTAKMTGIFNTTFMVAIEADKIQVVQNLLEDEALLIMCN